MYKGKFEWPNGAYIAVVFNMSWEIPPKTLGTTSGSKPRTWSFLCGEIHSRHAPGL